MRKLSLVFLLLVLAGCSTVNTPVSDSTHKMPNGEIMDHSSHMAAITSEKQFLQAMIPHHEEAVVTSGVIFKSTKDDQLKKFAQTVMNAQVKEVAEMKTWFKNWYGEEYTDAGTYMPMMGEPTSLTDDSYVTGMIFHHKGAVQMAEQVLEIQGINPETKALAENIIKAQTQEIEFLKSL